MSNFINVTGFSGKNSPEFQKHFKAVKFCIENQLSYPKETTEFFKGRVQNGNIEDYNNDCAIEYIKNGIEIDLKFEESSDYKKIINVKDIPPECEQIIIQIL